MHCEVRARRVLSQRLDDPMTWQCLQILTPIQGAYAFVGTWPWLPDKFAILTTIVESAESHQLA